MSFIFSPVHVFKRWCQSQSQSNTKQYPPCHLIGCIWYASKRRSLLVYIFNFFLVYINSSWPTHPVWCAFAHYFVRARCSDSLWSSASAHHSLPLSVILPRSLHNACALFVVVVVFVVRLSRSSPRRCVYTCVGQIKRIERSHICYSCWSLNRLQNTCTRGFVYFAQIQW